MQLGADPDQLDTLAAAMARAGLALDAVVVGLDSATADVAWHGADADRFRQEWRARLRPAVATTAATLQTGATDARRQTAEQRRTSDSSNLVAGGPGASGAGEGSGRTAAGRGAVVAPAPVGIRIVTAEVGASAEIASAAVSVRLRVEDLVDGRSRIVELDGIGVGAEAQADGRVTILHGAGSTGWGSGVVGAVSASVAGERSWVVPTGDVDDFLLSRVVDPAGTDGRSALGSVLQAVPGSGLAAAVFGFGDGYRAVTYDRPDPERVGIAVGAAGSADGDARVATSALAISGALENGVVLAASRSSIDGSIAMEISSSLVASAAGPHHGADVDWTGTTTLTVDRTGTPISLSTVLTSVDGDRVEYHRGVIDLTTPAVRSAAADLVDAIESAPAAWSSGDERVTDALRSLFAAGAGEVATRTDTYSVTGATSHGIELPMGSVEVTTEQLRLER